MTSKRQANFRLSDEGIARLRHMARKFETNQIATLELALQHLYGTHVHNESFRLGDPAPPMPRVMEDPEDAD